MSSASEKPSSASRRTSPAASEDATLPPPTSSSQTAAHVSQPRARSELPTQLPAAFGRYQLQKLLGQGGMGAVYLAHDTQLDRPVALKIPLLNTDEGGQVLARFYREARSAATLRHANVCPVYDVGEVDGVPYLTMAYIEGRSLGEWLRDRTLTPRQSAALVRKLALALQEAHQKGVIHRDLKPANIMIDGHGEPLIMDFGLARRDRPGDARLTQTGAVMGTPAYMPPEQISGNVEAMGPACDIYSLGVLLYELVAGRLPFQGDPMALLSQVLLDEPPPPSRFRPNLDRALESICLKAMAKKVEDRYRSMAELAAVLQDYLRRATATIPVPAARSDARTATDVPAKGRKPVPASPIIKAERKAAPPRPKSRARWPWFAGGAAMLLLLAGLVVFLLRSNSPSSDKPQSPSPHPDPEAPGVPLLRGNESSDWELAGGDPAVWTVADDAIGFSLSDPSRQRGWLLTRRDYTDFRLRCEFQLSPGADSGIGLRLWPGAPKPLEVQLQDDSFPAFAGHKPTERTGTLFGVAGQPAELRPRGEWNRLDIELRGWSLHVAVNDRETLRMQLNEDAVFRYLDGAPPAGGRIGLQHGLGRVRFRKLEIEDLSGTVNETAGGERKEP